MLNVTLKQLRYFEALVRTGHFGRAAADCAVSQPALSMQIRDLEAAMGAALFERGARRVEPTELGRALASRVRDIMRSVDELADLGRSAGTGLAGRLRLGVIPTVAPYLLPGMVACVTARYPQAELQVRETVTGRLIDELLDGRLDAALVALPVSEPALTEVALLREPFLLVRPAAEAHRPVPDREALREMRLLLLEEGHCFRDQALSFCDLDRARPREVLDASSLTTLVQMVAAGIGVTLLPEMAVAVETRRAPVAVARLPEPQPARTIGLIWRRTHPLAAQLHGLADAVGAMVTGRAGAADQGAPT